MIKKAVVLLVTLFYAVLLQAEDGYRLWLRYDSITDAALLKHYRQNITAIHFDATSQVLNAAAAELLQGLQGLMGQEIVQTNAIQDGSVVAGTAQNKIISSIISTEETDKTGKEGFIIKTAMYKGRKIIVVTATRDVGVLYGCFALLRLLQTNQQINTLNITSVPKVKLRMLNHWDNLNRTVERGYAGMSIWNWHKLPGYIDQRYIDYARANASVGINGVVLNNVNANAVILSPAYLEKVAALAAVFRPYGIKVYLSARFSAPIEIGNLETADPLNAGVQAFWQQKADELYSYIPDFGGFLVKANSEGQPGPQNYNRSHADGANMLAAALKPHGGIVIWRAFVYNNNDDDRFKQAYNEFQPLDGKFSDNVLVQVKNGPVDFQPREPFHPLFGAMPATPLMMEFQLTQEYLGFSTHLVFLAPLFKECLDADTYAKGKGSQVAKIVDGSLEQHVLSGMAGVSNIGSDINWTGHPFAQANWYALGRLAWDYTLSASEIADEWLRQTFTNDNMFLKAVKPMMLDSREICVNYMTPLGLHHLMGYSHHYGPAPWYNKAERADWNPVYFHKADKNGVGFDRTPKGSNAIAQYNTVIAGKFGNLKSCDEQFMLWFHHVPWTHMMQSGNNLWEALCYRYYSGADSVAWMQRQWESVKNIVDEERFKQVKMLLGIQKEEAIWWRNACVLYFQTFSGMQIPAALERPGKILDYYKSLSFPYAPGIGGNQ
ncbi:alpha-glucuronidase [Panacibacter sp. DH6]|uniref:Xylan alpha-1,2-glucuronidase n=1 Tax=Panacibacter microcysteis TaxID=2793269 RepID=A0A931GZM5_9BACT|nr:alpha-glucuronidase family glycosyl hydrolase [Panacibacter microcysteis]MBG9378311.1 alpha-glucuronidase [Panacibacter microcysteis]